MRRSRDPYANPGENAVEPLLVGRELTRGYRSSAGRFGSPQASPALAPSPELGRWDEASLVAAALAGPLDAQAAGVLGRAYQRLQRELAEARAGSRQPVDDDAETKIVDVPWWMEGR